MTLTEVRTEEAKIKKLLFDFFDAFDHLDETGLRKVFHSDASLSYVGPDGYRMMPIDDWIATVPIVKNNPDHIFNKEKAVKQIAYINITDSAASAKVEWKFTKFVFTDYYNLLNINGNWFIINKIWHTTNIPD